MGLYKGTSFFVLLPVNARNLKRNLQYMYKMHVAFTMYLRLPYTISVTFRKSHFICKVDRFKVFIVLSKTKMQ